MSVLRAVETFEDVLVHRIVSKIVSLIVLLELLVKLSVLKKRLDAWQHIVAIEMLLRWNVRMGAFIVHGGGEERFMG